MSYLIEGRDQAGQWSEDSVISGGNPQEVNRFKTKGEADHQITELAKIFECSEDDLRVAEATFTVICTDPASHVESCTFDRTVWGEADAMLQFSIDYGLDARVVRVEE
jgi:hypothetical protein